MRINKSKLDSHSVADEIATIVSMVRHLQNNNNFIPKKTTKIVKYLNFNLPMMNTYRKAIINARSLNTKKILTVLPHLNPFFRVNTNAVIDAVMCEGVIVINMMRRDHYQRRLTIPTLKSSGLRQFQHTPLEQKRWQRQLLRLPIAGVCLGIGPQGLCNFKVEHLMALALVNDYFDNAHNLLLQGFKIEFINHYL